VSEDGILEDDITERVAGIQAAGVMGYSRLMSDDKLVTIAVLDDYSAVFHEHITAEGGRASRKKCAAFWL